MPLTPPRDSTAFHERYAAEPDFRARVDQSRRDAHRVRASKKRRDAIKLMGTTQPDPKARLY